MFKKKEILDKSKFRRKVILGLASHPLTLFPVLLGLTVVLGVWALGIGSGTLAFGGLVSMFGGIGIFLTRLLMGGGSIYQEALDEIVKEMEQKHEKQLDDLAKRLSADTDERDENLLAELRAISKIFQEGPPGADNLNQTLLYDVLAKAELLYQGCLENLEKNLKLLDLAKKLPSREAQLPLLQQREDLVREVRASVTHLSKILADIQSFKKADPVKGVDLSGIRRQLDESLEVAKKVEERLNQWDLDGPSIDRELHSLENHLK